jgi:hypothetical protein
MPVVIADRVSGGKIRDPAGFEQRDQPRLMLAADSDWTGNRNGQRASHADGAIEDGVNPAKECSAECGEAMRDQLSESFHFIDAADANLGTVMHVI